MTAWRTSVAFRLFAITFVAVMLLLGVLLSVLAGSFSSFYERRQIKDISSQMNSLREQYAREGIPSVFDGRVPPYFLRFQSDYYAIISVAKINGNRVQIQRYPEMKETESGAAGGMPSDFRFPPGLAGPGEQDEKFMLAFSEWRQDEEAYDKVLGENKTLVYRARDGGSDQLIAVAPVETDGAAGGTVLFAVSSLQPVIGASKVIRDFSWYAFGFACVLVPALAFLYAGILTKPLRQLNELAGRLASLDFSARSRWRRKDEIGRLAETFDFLADNLQGALSELHEANDRLRADIEKEKKLERMRRDFVTGVSHELKTPLSLIGGYAEGLQDNIGSGAKREKYAEVILDETRRMSAIVGDLLDLSQLESGQYRLKLAPFDAATLLRESGERAEALGAARNVRVEARLPGSGEGAGSGAAEPVLVTADRFRIGQVLTNLVTNAVRHARDGGTVRLSAERNGGEWLFAVLNDGEPIPEAELPLIWSQFYRVDKARDRQSGGTGIGLAIVKQILELHGSRYGASNEPGGVTFAFTLPASSDLADSQRHAHQI